MSAKRNIPHGESGKGEQAIQPITEDKSTFTREYGNEDEETDDDEL